jgi:hypothetical protein
MDDAQHCAAAQVLAGISLAGCNEAAHSIWNRYRLAYRVRISCPGNVSGGTGIHWTPPELALFTTS